MRYTIWENVWLPQQLRKDDVNLLHVPMNYGVPVWSPCPIVLTLHDAIDPIYYGRKTPLKTRLRYGPLRSQWMHYWARTRADHIITVSHHAAYDLHRYLRIAPKNITVIYEAADPEFHQPYDPIADSQTLSRYDLTRDYFFYVGGWEARKNIPFLLRAFAAADLKQVDLVLAGGRPTERAALEQLAQALGISQRVRCCGFVPDADLPAFYRGAKALIYPSEYEGFGLQVCEAMACSCPVVVANRTSLPEIAGDAGLRFELEPNSELPQILSRLIHEPSWQQSCSLAAKQRSLAFSWDQCAEATLATYNNILKQTC
jgi:glycosyltransferase involved in cell wall biosynthesis